jgi:hypothetical protein
MIVFMDSTTCGVIAVAVVSGILLVLIINGTEEKNARANNTVGDGSKTYLQIKD